REKVKKLLEGTGKNESWIPVLLEISPQTYERRFKHGWTREQIIAVSAILAQITHLRISVSELIDD
ncbi:MAG: hypothetical protein KAS32_16340, partial [Candidatus Peribacteraceae bacterium]|nr:hypothetical protein [Candidatus Peribacteraceae bacterium]